LTDVNVILFEDFETLDAFGPAEVLGKLDRLYRVRLFSQGGGLVRSSQGVLVQTLPLAQMEKGGVLLLPGGMGTRREIHNEALVGAIKTFASAAPFVLTVCTGAALLAKTGLLSGKSATTNKMAFGFVSGADQSVRWVKKARWAVDGKYYTSSGVSAGIDMALGFVKDQIGEDAARKVAAGIEYVWNEDKENDPFFLNAPET